jgi:polygalacturonase
MKIYKIVIFSIISLLSLTLSAKDYKASLFGCKSDGVTLNTGSIQYAIDFISENGGGTLQFFVGRYLTGSFELKSNVTIELNEGAILVGMPSIYDYLEMNDNRSLITADGQENIGIAGKGGVIEGQGYALQSSIKKQVQKGYLNETIAQLSPSLVYFNNCSNVTVENIIMQNACGDIQLFEGCKNVTLKGLIIKSETVAGSKGLVIDSCKGVAAADLYFETSGVEYLSKNSTSNVTFSECINSKGKKIKAKQ